MSNATNTDLALEHLELLGERAIDESAAKAHGLRSVCGEEGAKLLGRAAPLQSSGLGIPYPNADYARLRLDDPKACGGNRYLAPSDQAVPVYIPNGVTDDGALTIVEGPLKAIALCVNGIPSVALGGVSTTLEPGPTPKLNRSWDALKLRDRRVNILFDTDRRANEQVQRAEARLANALQAAGADVRIAKLDTLVDTPSTGPDDVVAAGRIDLIHQALATSIPASLIERVQAASKPEDVLDDELFVAIYATATPGMQAAVGIEFRNRKWSVQYLKQAAKRLGAKSSGSSAAHYAIKDSKLIEVSGDSERVLADCALEILEDISSVDGVEHSRSWIVRATFPDGTACTRTVPVAQLDRPTIIPELFGAQAVTYAPPSIVRAAIQCVSRPAVRRQHEATGFIEHEGKLAYLHGAGVIGATSEPVEVALSGPLAIYTFEGLEGVSAHDMTRRLLLLKDLAEAPVGVLLMAAMAGAPLAHFQPPTFAILLYGSTNTFKTSMAIVVLSAHAKAPFGRTTIGADSTAAAIESALHFAKDTVVVIDDFVSGRSDTRNPQTHLMEQVVRAIGNGQARHRLQRNLSARRARPPRCLSLITGEHLIGAVESIQTRLLMARVKPNSVDTRILTTLQQSGPDLRAATVSYIEQIQRRKDTVGSFLPSRALQLRTLFNGYARHARVAGSLGHAAATLEVMFACWRDAGAITREEHEDLWSWALDALADVALEHNPSAQSSDPVTAFINGLDELTSAGSISTPPEGNEVAIRGPGEFGWRFDDRVFVRFEAAFRKLNELRIRGGQGDLGVTADELKERLAERGILKRPTGEAGRYSKNVRIPNAGTKRFVELVLPPDPSETPTLPVRAAPREQLPRDVRARLDAKGNWFVESDNGIVATYDSSGGWLGHVDPNATLTGHDLADLLVRMTAAGQQIPRAVVDTRALAILADGAAHLGVRDGYGKAAVAARLGIPADEVIAIAERLARQTDELGLAGLVDLGGRVAVATARMAHRGVPIDRGGLVHAVDQATTEMADAAYEFEVLTGVGPNVDEIELVAGLVRSGSPAATTTTTKLAPLTPALLALRKFRSARSFARDSGPALLDALDKSADGRVRATLDPLGTVTGRFAAAAPNILGIPRSARPNVTARDAYLLVTADFAAQELRIAAAISGDERLLDLFKRDADPHTETAIALFGSSATMPANAREIAKVFNFITIYGGGIEAIRTRCARHNLILSDDEIEKLQMRFFAHYTGLDAWCVAQAASQSPVITTPMGRRRSVSGARSTQRINSPIQMLAADAFKLALIAVEERIAHLGAYPILPLHDEIVVESPDSSAADVARIVTDVMVESLGYVLDYRVPVKVAVAVDRHWVKP